MQEQWTGVSLIYFTADVLSVLWPLSWGQQFRKWRGGSTWLCHTHLFNWSDLIRDSDCKLSESPEWWRRLSSMGCSPGPWASWIILCKSLFCFPGHSPHHFPPVPSRWLVFLPQQLKFNYPLFHDLMVFHLFNLHKFWSRLWFQSSSESLYKDSLSPCLRVYFCPCSLTFFSSRQSWNLYWHARALP